jgi:hypothetical protein
MDVAGIPNSSACALTDISDIEALRQRFNQDKGLPRFILLFSPT